jgi:hypothetical protein
VIYEKVHVLMLDACSGLSRRKSFIGHWNCCAGLVGLSETELTGVMGGTLAAKKLRDWLDAAFPHL